MRIGRKCWHGMAWDLGEACFCIDHVVSLHRDVGTLHLCIWFISFGRF